MRPILGILLAAAVATPSAAQAPPQVADSYYRAAQADLAVKLRLRPNTNRAKNVILFVGDGMGVNTLTVARIYAGQKLGVDGESYVTTIDAMPYAALVKTYAHDAQVSDFAPTATALMSGIKTLNDLIGLDQTALLDDCPGSKTKHVGTLFETAETAGYATGIISTARITHATPAAAYAHIANRDWENDAALPAAAKAAGCPDIASQLLAWPYGDGFEVVLGGGRAQFTPNTQADPEHPAQRGLRTDGRDLIAEWRARNATGAYVWNKADFDALPASTPRVLGLFEPDHMQFEADRSGDVAGEPSLAELTRKGIAMLSRSRRGYVLLVEAGRIDHAHHGGNAARALADTVALDEAVKAALGMVDLRDTLVVVTADHSHALAMNGYPKRGNPILGVVVGVDDKPMIASDGKAFTTLTYGTGPGGSSQPRVDPRTVDTTALDYRQQSVAQTSSATHGGEDVAVRAAGPFAHLFEGTIEQNLIYHVIRHALRISDRAAPAAPRN